jgi:hypothetical protein
MPYQDYDLQLIVQYEQGRILGCDDRVTLSRTHRNQKENVTPTAVRASLDDPPIHIRPTFPAIAECKTKEPFGFRPLRREGIHGSLTLAAQDIRAPSGVGAVAKTGF